MSQPGTSAQHPLDRTAARVIVLDDHGRVLLLKCRAGDDPHGHFWITPGGGLDEGESHEQAALRELREEVGLDTVDLGPHVWTRTHTFPWLGRWLRQHEHYFLARIGDHEPTQLLQTQDELMYLLGNRWWTPAEIADAAQQGERFAPRHFAELLKTLLDEGPPAEPRVIHDDAPGYV